MSVTRSGGSTTPTEPPDGTRYRRTLKWSDALRELWGSRELVRTLLERDLRVRYKQTVLGFGWSLAGPVVFMLVFTIFFNRAGHFATGGVPYPLFSYTALVPWSFLSEAIATGSGSLLANTSLMNKVYCPREVFPLATIAAAAFDALISAVILVVLFIIYQYPPTLSMLWVPLLVLIEIVFCLGVILVCSSVLVYLRDVRYVVPLAIQVGMFISPVVYGLSVIPARLRPFYAVANPVGPILDDFRRTLLHGQGPQWSLLGLAAAASVAWLAGGYRLFKRLEIGFADIA